MGSKNFKNQNRNNYNQYAKKAETDQVNEEAVEEVVEKVVEPIPEPKTYGTVNCSKLNVRKEPSIHSNPLCIVESGTEMEIEIFNNEWVKVVTPDGVSGYCMKKFIDLK